MAVAVIYTQNHKTKFLIQNINHQIIQYNQRKPKKCKLKIWHKYTKKTQPVSTESSKKKLVEKNERFKREYLRVFHKCLKYP